MKTNSKHQEERLFAKLVNEQKSIIGGIIGGACGLIYDFSLYHKQQKIRQQLIDQINDLKSGE